MDRNEAISRIKAALKARSEKRWSVKGGRGTSWGWITIDAPPSRIGCFSELTPADQQELSELFGVKVHQQGISIPAGSDYYAEYVDRAEGRTPAICGEQYWD